MDGKAWYKQQLQKSEWKEKRAEIYARDGHACVDCKKRGVTIHCHHNHYVKGMKPWDYPAYALVTVCKDCHDKRHKAVILRHDSHEDAEMWYLFMEVEAAMLEEELAERRRRIDWIEEHGGIWEGNGRYYALVDKDGQEWFFDENGSEM